MNKQYYVSLKEDYECIESDKRVSLTFNKLEDVVDLIEILNRNVRSVIIETEICSFEYGGD